MTTRKGTPYWVAIEHDEENRPLLVVLEDGSRLNPQGVAHLGGHDTPLRVIRAQEPALAAQQYLQERPGLGGYIHHTVARLDRRPGDIPLDVTEPRRVDWGRVLLWAVAAGGLLLFVLALVQAAG